MLKTIDQVRNSGSNFPKKPQKKKLFFLSSCEQTPTRLHFDLQVKLVLLKDGAAAGSDGSDGSDLLSRVQEADLTQTGSPRQNKSVDGHSLERGST